VKRKKRDIREKRKKEREREKTEKLWMGENVTVNY
jgi:hypothetical protein